MENFLHFILNAIFAGVASLGFAMVFNVPKKALIYCAVGGSITLSLRNIFLNYGLSLELSAFFASTIIGIISLYWSRKNKTSRPTYTVASIIPIIPGTYAIKSMTILINMNNNGVNAELINAFIENGLKTVSILGAITFGIALPSIYFFRNNKYIV